MSKNEEKECIDFFLTLKKKKKTVVRKEAELEDREAGTIFFASISQNKGS